MWPNTGTLQILYHYERGWATTCEIEAAVNLLGIHVNVWLPLQDTNSFMVSRFTPQIQIDLTSVISINLLLENAIIRCCAPNSRCLAPVLKLQTMYIHSIQHHILHTRTICQQIPNVMILKMINNNKIHVKPILSL